jgi:hypothetical protein
MNQWLKMALVAMIAAFSTAAVLDYLDTQTMGVGIRDIHAVKAECEKAGAKCVMLWDFVKVENDYE